MGWGEEVVVVGVGRLWWWMEYTLEQLLLSFPWILFFSSYNPNTPACNASGSQTFHPKLFEASSLVEPLMKPNKVWGETFGYQKRYRLVCWDCMKNDDPARIPIPLNINVAFQFHSILLAYVHSYCVLSFLTETCLLGIYICLKVTGARAAQIKLFDRKISRQFWYGICNIAMNWCFSYSQKMPPLSFTDSFPENHPLPTLK